MTESTPICRCRVLYLGSAVPRQSKDGLQGIQEPLRSLYPSEGAAGARGIDSWLSVWSNGILLENVDENRKQVTRFFPIDSLHYCAAVRHVLVPDRSRSDPEPKFLPLDSPFAKAPARSKHPPLFAAILRRTSGIKVLECHAFICKREAAANALVRCCFHAYADSSYAKHQSRSSDGSLCGTLSAPVGWGSRAGSTATIDTIGTKLRHEDSTVTYASSAELAADDSGSIYNGDENHKIWGGSVDRLNDLDADIYSGGSTLGRPARVRQISEPAPPPPPPLTKESKDQNRKKKRSRPAPGQQQLMRAPPMMVYHAAPIPRQFHTFSHRSRPPPIMLPPQQFMHSQPQFPQQMQRYPQYATLQAPKMARKKQRHSKNAANIPVPMTPMMAPMFVYPPTLERPLATISRKLSLSQAEGLDRLGQENGTSGGGDSPNGTGIYRRKGHLNERAFSYSIRQEHRSRSHGSLASLQFSPQPSKMPQQQETREDAKKEREIMQMVAGLDLNDGTETSHLMNGSTAITYNGRGPPPPPLASLGIYGKARR